MAKFVFDILATSLGTIFIFPVFLLLCICVAIENRGRIFFVHKRVGRNGKLFPCYKFQTMVKDSDLVLQDYLQNNPQAQKEWAANFKLTDDPRVTRLGRILRKTSLDELPQIFNVLKGEMSLVGPRPIVPAEIEKYGKYIREYYMVRPGITGVWQTNGRSDTTYQERVAMDTWYVRNRSIWLDLKCLAKTVSAVIKKKRSLLMNMTLPCFGIVIPTYNAGIGFVELLKDIERQTIKPVCKLLIDSSSTDSTIEFAGENGWLVRKIAKSEFGHGKTRQQALDIILQHNSNIEVLIYLTQDVRISCPKSFEYLLNSLANANVVAAYGRQRPHKNASIYAAVDRDFNYPAKGYIKSLQDAKKLGIKTAFLSDSFAAYRIKDLQMIGGFPDVDICEDMYVAGKLLLAGKKIAYVSKAEVEHSHEPKIVEIWKRYSAMGRFQKNNPWIRQNFGTAGAEGKTLLIYKLKIMLKKRKLYEGLKMCIYDVIKFAAYKIAK